MRMMMRVQMVTEAANAAIADGTLGALLESTMDRLQPEAAYFTAVDGLRTGFMFFELSHQAQIPALAAPWCQARNATIDVLPALGPDAVAAGIQAWHESSS